jgi:hypothetical protein
MGHGQGESRATEHEQMGHQGESRATEYTSRWVMPKEKAAPQNIRADGSCTYRNIGPTAVDKCFVEFTARYSLGLRTVLQRNRPVCLMQAVLQPAKPLTNERQQIHRPPAQVLTAVLLTM